MGLKLPAVHLGREGMVVNWHIASQMHAEQNKNHVCACRFDLRLWRIANAWHLSHWSADMCTQTPSYSATNGLHTTTCSAMDSASSISESTTKKRIKVGHLLEWKNHNRHWDTYSTYVWKQCAHVQCTLCQHVDTRRDWPLRSVDKAPVLRSDLGGWNPTWTNFLWQYHNSKLINPY